MNLAIISPAQNAYSETFIQAHKKIPGPKIYYYYGGLIPVFLEGKGFLTFNGIGNRIISILRRRIMWKELSASEDVFRNSLKTERIDCVLAEYGHTGATVLNVCSELNLPLVVHFHGFDASQCDIIEKYRTPYNRMFRYASFVIAVSRVMEMKLISMGCPREKVIYNPYGPDDLFFDVHPGFEKKLFICIGRFVDKKAPYYTLLAFQKLLQWHPEAQLIVAGDGPLLNTCLNLAKYFKIENNVIFPGVIEPTKYRDYLQEACAFIQHSVTATNGDMEGTPVAVLEASAAGLPVVSTFHAGIPDVIIDGETGLLVKEHDVEGMAHSLKWVLENREAAKQMGRNGKQRIWANFTLKRHLDTLRNAIEKSVNRKAVNDIV